MPEVNEASPIRGALGKKKVRQVVSDAETMAHAYKATFTTREGKVVLADLLTRFYDHPMDGVDLNREAGRRDVLHFIKRKMTP